MQIRLEHYGNISAGTVLVFMNAIQFLDEPGEWFVDMKNRKVYDYPRADETLTNADVVAPVLETVVKIEGSIDKPVTNVSFNGISFMHTSWLRPSTHGHVPHQAGMYMLEAYKLHQPGTAEKGPGCDQLFISGMGTTRKAVNLVLSAGSIFSLGVGTLYLWVLPPATFDFWPPHYLLLSFYLFVILTISDCHLITRFVAGCEHCNPQQLHASKTNAKSLDSLDCIDHSDGDLKTWQQ